jgi:serine/threonine protein kinase
MSVREPASEEVDRLVGATVGDKYRIERLIGKGGMGAVYAAQNTAIGKRVALKFLSREAAQNAEAARRFQREAQAASLVESEHIVQVFDAGTSPDGLPFLVMEHLTGEDLRACLDREGQLGVPAALDIASQLLRALVRAHAAGIVHRDLKPDNVFLCSRDDGSRLVKIVDFGISKLERATLSERLTRRGTVLGSAYYMSPEQAQASDGVDQRSDLYGVGAILFEMLAGRPPHVAPTLESVLVAICTHGVPDVRSFRPDAPDSVAKAVATALAREPARRFDSAAEFLATIQGGASTSIWRRRAGRSRTLVAGVFATLAGFTLTAVLIARRAPPSRATSVATASTATTAPVAAAQPGPAPLATTPTTDLPNAPPEVRPVVETATPSSALKALATPSPPTAPKAADRKRRPRPSPAAPKAGVASSLQLSNREP